MLRVKKKYIDTMGCALKVGQDHDYQGDSITFFDWPNINIECLFIQQSLYISCSWHMRRLAYAWTSLISSLNHLRRAVDFCLSTHAIDIPMECVSPYSPCSSSRKG